MVPVQEGCSCLEADGLARWITSFGLAQQLPIAQLDPIGIDRQ
jgi:hypothetical protein